ncbi:MAG: AAA family ATPase [Henriciella sp.]|nr:AAA family ATPase [Henriciella sp.]
MTERIAIEFDGYVMDVVQDRREGWDDEAYPFNLPAIRSWETLQLHEKVTFLVGENGSGKSTLIEAIAVAAGFNPEGGSRDHNFKTRDTHSELHSFLRLVKPPIRPKDGYYLRAESFYAQSSYLDDVAALHRYGGNYLHQQSHGESVMSLFWNRFEGKGLYILDEPEAALSPNRQLSFLAHLHDLVEDNSQFIIATHSPIILAYPNAWIYHMSETGPERLPWDALEHVDLTRQFLNNPEVFLDTLLERDNDTG